MYLKDLTDLARTQELLAHSEAQFAEFADILPEVVFETDRAGRITFLNRAGIEKLGYRKDDWPERPSAFEFLEPADRPRAEGNFRRVMAGEYLGPNEYRARSRDGRTIPILLISCRIERDGVPAGTRGFIVDMSARAEADQALKVSEERLRMATEGARIALWDWNLDTGEAYCNEEYFRILGYEPGEFVPSYEKWLELVHPEDRRRAEKQVQQQLIEDRGSFPSYSDEYRMRAKDGSWRWIQDFGRVLERDAAGAPRRALGIHIDITERKKSEEVLRASEQKFSDDLPRQRRRRGHRQPGGRPLHRRQPRRQRNNRLPPRGTDRAQRLRAQHLGRTRRPPPPDPAGRRAGHRAQLRVPFPAQIRRAPLRADLGGAGLRGGASPAC